MTGSLLAVGDDEATRQRLIDYARMFGGVVGEMAGEVVAVEFPDYPAALDWCTAAAYDAAEFKPTLVRLALELGDPLAIVRWVQRHIEWRDEPGERLAYPTTTLRRGAGDCDCIAILVCSMVTAIGHPAIVAALTVDGDPKHAACAFLNGGRAYWLDGSENVGPMSWESHPMDRDARDGARGVVFPRAYRGKFPAWQRL